MILITYNTKTNVNTAKAHWWGLNIEGFRDQKIFENSKSKIKKSENRRRHPPKITKKNKTVAGIRQKMKNAKTAAGICQQMKMLKPLQASVKQ